MENAVPRNIVVNSNVQAVVSSVVKEPLVRVLPTIELSANVLRATLAAHLQSVDQNVMETVIVHHLVLLVFMAFVKILVMERVV